MVLRVRFAPSGLIIATAATAAGVVAEEPEPYNDLVANDTPFQMCDIDCDGKTTIPAP